MSKNLSYYCMDENVFTCWQCGNSQDYEGMCDSCKGDGETDCCEMDTIQGANGPVVIHERGCKGE